MSLVRRGCGIHVVSLRFRHGAGKRLPHAPQKSSSSDRYRNIHAIRGLLNLIGAFLSLAVAATIASGLVNTADVTLTVVAAGLAGGIIWNLMCATRRIDISPA